MPWQGGPTVDSPTPVETITVHKLPLRFLIGSRPESHIRDCFDEESLYTVTRQVALDETFDPGRDIRVFLQDDFAKIRPKNSIPSLVVQPWPEEGIIDLLVQRSSGQFIYAAIVLKFVGAEFHSPTKRLALVLKPDPTAFSDLDQLYTQSLIRLSKYRERCSSSGIHHCIWWEFARGDWRYPRNGRWTETSATWSVVLNGRWDRGVLEYGGHLIHPSLRTCFISWLFVQFQVARANSMSIDRNM